MFDDVSSGEGGGGDEGQFDGDGASVVFFTDEHLDFAERLAMLSARHSDQGQPNGEEVFNEQQSAWVAEFRAKFDQLQHIPFTTYYNLPTLFEAVALLPSEWRLSGEVGLARLVGGEHVFPQDGNCDAIVDLIMKTTLSDPPMDAAETN